MISCMTEKPPPIPPIAHPVYPNSDNVLARYTLWLTIATSVIAVAGIFTLVAAFLQWSSLKSTDETTREALTAAQRAFVFVKDISYGKLPNYLATTPTGIRLIVAWENSGTTPTKSLITHVSWEVFTPDIPANFDFPDRGGGPDNRALIGPKASMNMAPVDIPIDVFQAIQAGTHRLYIWGWADYDDIFKDTERHRTEFSSQILVTGSLSDAIPGLTFVMHTKYNGSDGETVKKPKPHQASQ
jgi:hypothetical protein